MESTSRSTSNRSASVPTRISPALATKVRSSKVTSTRSIECDTWFHRKCLPSLWRQRRQIPSSSLLRGAFRGWAELRQVTSSVDRALGAGWRNRRPTGGTARHCPVGAEHCGKCSRLFQATPRQDTASGRFIQKPHSGRWAGTSRVRPPDAPDATGVGPARLAQTLPSAQGPLGAALETAQKAGAPPCGAPCRRVLRVEHAWSPRKNNESPLPTSSQCGGVANIASRICAGRIWRDAYFCHREQRPSRISVLF